MAEVTFKLEEAQAGAVNWLAILQGLAKNLPAILALVATLFPKQPEPPH